MRLKKDHTGNLRLVPRPMRDNRPELAYAHRCIFEYGLRCNAPAVWSDSPKGDAVWCRHHSDPRRRSYDDEQRAYISSTYEWDFAETMILESKTNTPAFECYRHMLEHWHEWKRQPGESQAEFVARHRALQSGMQGLKEVPR